MSVSLERMVVPSADQLSELHAVCSQAPAYWQLTEGKPLPGKEAIAAWFDGSELPAGRQPGDQYIYGLRHADELVGVVIAWRGWPYPEQSTIGLLLLAERWQGRGLGRSAYQRIEALIRTWPRMRTVRLGIIAGNAAAFHFWRKLGFRETGERRRDRGFLADTILLEKTL